MIHLTSSTTPPVNLGALMNFDDGDEDDPALDRLDGRRVLLLEDEVFIAVEVRRALEAAGAEVVYARTLPKALKALEAAPVEAAILDVTLGHDHNCKPVAMRLREAGVPYILHSGDLDRQGEVLAELDAPVIPKPADAETVVLTLARILAAAD